MEITIKNKTYKTEANANVAFDVLRAYGYTKITDLSSLFDMGDDPEIQQIEAVSSLARYAILEEQRVRDVPEDTQEAPSVRDLTPALLREKDKIRELIEELMQFVNEGEDEEQSKQSGSGDKKKTG